MSKPTRAKLLRDPYRIRKEARLTAVVEIEGQVTQVWLRQEQADLKAGDTVAVLRNGMEWRVG